MTWTHGAELFAAAFVAVWIVGIVVCARQPRDRPYQPPDDPPDPLSYEEWSKDRSDPYR